jgi:hypothetical protein
MNQSNRQGNDGRLASQTLRLSYLFPIVLQWRGLARKGFLVPAALTVLVASLLAGSKTSTTLRGHSPYTAHFLFSTLCIVYAERANRGSSCSRRWDWEY